MFAEKFAELFLFLHLLFIVIIDTLLIIDNLFPNIYICIRLWINKDHKQNFFQIKSLDFFLYDLSIFFFKKIITHFTVLYKENFHSIHWQRGTVLAYFYPSKSSCTIQTVLSKCQGNNSNVLFIVKSIISVGFMQF